MMIANKPLISAVYTTRNRKNILLESIGSVLAQEGVELEVLVYDDVSDDGTAEAVRKRFPDVRVIENDVHQERLRLRNRGFREAQGDFILSIDDDCYFTSTTALESALRYFEDRKIAVVALPFIEPFRKRERSYFPAREISEGTEVRSFVACAALLRRKAVLEVQGYREELIAHREESDLSARLIDRGWRLIYAGGKHLVHTTSPTRIVSEETVGYIRNLVLLPFLIYPTVHAAKHMMSGLVAVFTVSFRNRRVRDKIKGGWFGVVACWQHRRLRDPIDLDTYYRLRELPDHGSWWHDPCDDVPESCQDDAM